MRFIQISDIIFLLSRVRFLFQEEINSKGEIVCVYMCGIVKVRENNIDTFLKRTDRADVNAFQLMGKSHILNGALYLISSLKSQCRLSCICNHSTISMKWSNAHADQVPSRRAHEFTYYTGDTQARTLTQTGGIITFSISFLKYENVK